jgi:DNA-binding transcriptional MerR regulator
MSTSNRYRNESTRNSRIHEQTTTLLSVDLVAARTGVSVRRVRYLCRTGLVSPAIESEREVLFGEDAIERIQLIERLITDLGVNLPGAEVILHMRERMLALLDELDRQRRG